MFTIKNDRLSRVWRSLRHGDDLDVQQEINGLLKTERRKGGKHVLRKQGWVGAKGEFISSPLALHPPHTREHMLGLPGSEISRSIILTRLVLLVHIFYFFSLSWLWFCVSISIVYSAHVFPRCLKSHTKGPTGIYGIFAKIRVLCEKPRLSKDIDISGDKKHK